MQEIPVLHGKKDSHRNDVRIRRVLILFGIITLIAAAAVTVSLIWREPTSLNNPNEMPSQIITIGVTLLWGVIIIFFWSMKMTPLMSYRRYLKECYQGLSRYEEGVITQVDQQTTFRDGLSFYGMILNVGDLDNPEDERLLYWDPQLGEPPVKEGDRVRVRAHGNDVIGIAKE